MRKVNHERVFWSKAKRSQMTECTDLWVSTAQGSHKLLLL